MWKGRAPVDDENRQGKPEMSTGNGHIQKTKHVMIHRTQ